ncbi:heterokaryon incompatibility protein-domain-containing protein [Alternaria rosae]|uniref:heterokaryon incompatibility protein-domain-containing protein n=1 Tax=Alternaria rosae TaxID=1187941 RepID=UPI001E8CFF84|nr:heterokaryon incompatibility protein-domain-containing protein [Alternaria rosae]KAH6868335.1 heterokaryon incompatibility protein-domain-containing protein [Alternaria rosae]
MPDQALVPPNLFRPLGEDQIRILILNPSKDREARLAGQLDVQTVSRGTDGGQAPGRTKYTALSYFWGSNTEKGSIALDTGDLAIPLSLQKFLLSLRHNTKRIRFWADAPCINQFDKEELSFQVGLMGQIYSQAAKIILWLPEGDEASWRTSGDSLALNLRGHGDRFNKAELSWVSDWTIARAATLLPYRSWIVQEFLGTPKTLVFTKRGVHMLAHRYPDGFQALADSIRDDLMCRIYMLINLIDTQDRFTDDLRQAYLRILSAHYWNGRTKPESGIPSNTSVSFIQLSDSTYSGVTLTPLAIAARFGQLEAEELLQTFIHDTHKSDENNNNSNLTMVHNLAASLRTNKAEKKEYSAERVGSPSNFEQLETTDVAIRGYVMFWTCNCGHKGLDHYIEHRSGSVQELLKSLQDVGIDGFIEPWDPLQPERFDIGLAFRRFSMTVQNIWRWLATSMHTYRQSLTMGWLSNMPVIIDQPSSKVAKGKMPCIGSVTTSPTASLQYTANDTPPTTRGAADTDLMSEAEHSSQSSSSSTTDISTNQIAINIPEDFILLCMRAKRFLTNRHDLGLFGITCDRKLFEAFRKEYNGKVRWAFRHFSIRTAQRMSFVKFALHDRSEVDGIMTGMPPDTFKHYTCDPRKPERIPALGSDFLMHRFISPMECFDDDICLKQMPKRVGEPPKPGIDPDLYTGWGMHIEEGLDFERICLLLFFGIVSGGTFGIVWAICKKSLQDGFAVAGFIVGIGAVAIATLQLLLAFETI